MELKVALIDVIWLFPVLTYTSLCPPLCGSPPLPYTLIKVLEALATPLNKYLKWQAIQLAILSTVGVAI